MEIKDATRCAFMAPSKELMTVDFTQLAKDAQQMRAERDAANPPKPEPAQKELARLRHELFCLEQRAASTETYCNNKADEVKLLDHQITEALKNKKAAGASGNLLAERHAERTIQRLEGERDGVVREFERARKVSAQAARELKEWPHHKRVEELSKEIG